MPTMVVVMLTLTMVMTTKMIDNDDDDVLWWRTFAVVASRAPSPLSDHRETSYKHLLRQTVPSSSICTIFYLFQVFVKQWHLRLHWKPHWSFTHKEKDCVSRECPSILQSNNISGFSFVWKPKFVTVCLLGIFKDQLELEISQYMCASKEYMQGTGSS